MKAYFCYLIGLQVRIEAIFCLSRKLQTVVKCKHFTCNLPALVVDGIGPNLLGLKWFQASDFSI
ncbi:hypothetical protein PR048_025162 [Dryococelus australis]|uniref:Uncharacterized protein n=1 Tax=Dryococelus australis TaxID=614101 RepID=A0ABQ9GQL9_9NEOP|nr:hypothetical protein PR048_025162 [Dryococelus australis]